MWVEGGGCFIIVDRAPKQLDVSTRLGIISTRMTHLARNSAGGRERKPAQCTTEKVLIGRAPHEPKPKGPKGKYGDPFGSRPDTYESSTRKNLPEGHDATLKKVHTWR